MRKFVKETEGKLELFFLPSCAPNLNPVEHVWNWLKNHKTGKTFLAEPNQFKATVRFLMRSLLAQAQKVAGFFRHLETGYAAN
ncbi:MAG: transposase [Magnetococcus sp. YQC-9]